MSEEKPKFTRKAKEPPASIETIGPPTEKQYAKGQRDRRLRERPEGAVKREQMLAFERDRLNDQLLMTEWAISSKQQVYGWLQDVKGFTLEQARTLLKRRPLPQWHRIQEYVQNHYSNSLVKRHVEQAAQLNDQHMMAAKLGMAKAMEFLSKMSVETRVDKHGRPYFAHFRTTDLKNCMEAIHLAQRITRTALGLPTDEGSVHIWQKIQQSINLNMPTVEDIPPEGEDLNVQVLKLQKQYTYDDIKQMIGAFRQAGLRSDPNTIDAETTTK